MSARRTFQNRQEPTRILGRSGPSDMLVTRHETQHGAAEKCKLSQPILWLTTSTIVWREVDVQLSDDI